MKNISNVLYSCVLLDNKSHDLLLTTFSDKIPNDWKRIAHHMTICFGELKDVTEIGKTVNLTVTHIGFNDKAMAVLVNGFRSKNTNPHVTLAINPNSGKPKDSNTITDWVNVEEFTITGVVTEVKQ